MKTPVYLSIAVAAFAILQPASLTAQNISPAAGPTANLNQTTTDGFVMVGGKTYIVRRGVATPLEREITLRITPTGIVGFDQRSRIISNSTMLTFDGRLVAAPAGLVFPPAPVVIVDPRLQDRGVYGQMLSGLAPTTLGAVKSSKSSGPHNVIAKNRSSAKSTRGTSAAPTSSAPSRSATKARPASAPVFSDDLIPLPNHRFNDNGSISAVIDAGSTMLSVTTQITPAPTSAPASAPSPTAPDVSGIGASLSPNIRALINPLLPPDPGATPASAIRPPMRPAP